MIRRAEARDASRINELLYQVQAVHAELYPEIFRVGEKKYTDSALVEIIRCDRTPIFVCEEDGLVKGYAFCVLKITENDAQRVDRKEVYIDDLCVDEAERRQGVGRKLFDHVKTFAKEQGFDAVTLNVWNRNVSAYAFYESLGMTPQKTTMELTL